MGEGIKKDQGKPRLSLLSSKWLNGVGLVLNYGAKKYTEYAKCDCVQTEISKELLPEDSVKTATIKCSRTKIQNIEPDSSPTDPDGQSLIERASGITTKVMPEIKQQKDTESHEPKSTESYQMDANSAETKKGFVSITATSQEKSGDVYAYRATLESDGLKKENGLNTHSPTCSSTRVIQEGTDNWRLGLKQRRLIDAALRHLLAYNDGEDLDPETGLSHLLHLSCCAMFAFELRITHPHLDDRFTTRQWPK